MRMRARRSGFICDGRGNGRGNAGSAPIRSDSTVRAARVAFGSAVAGISQERSVLVRHGWTIVIRISPRFSPPVTKVSS